MAVFLVVLRIICNFRINKPEQDFPAMREASIFKHLRDRGVLYCGNIYPLIHAIYYVDTVEIVEIEKQYKQECV